MTQELIATATTTIKAPKDKVWNALIKPDLIRQYMFGTEVISDWKPGSSIVWKGSWEGKPYEDKGVIKKIVPGKILQVTHFSPITGLPDIPENYHTLTYELTQEGDSTFISLTQDNNSSEKEKHHSQEMWEALLASLKKLLEK
jgi:uncharacterized protein YndB with AHSA1/START domain